MFIQWKTFIWHTRQQSLFFITIKDQRSVDYQCCHRLSSEGKHLWSAVVQLCQGAKFIVDWVLCECNSSKPAPQLPHKSVLSGRQQFAMTNGGVVMTHLQKKSWANLSMWSALALLVSMPRTPRLPNFHSCFTNGSEWVLEQKSCTHTLHSSLAEQGLSYTDKNHLYEAQANASLFGRAQAMRWANSHDETSLTGCLTTLLHQGVYWSPPPQGLSGHRRCWWALNIVRSDYNSPTWAKNLPRAELILCMITVFRCSGSVLNYSAQSDLAFN